VVGQVMDPIRAEAIIAEKRADLVVIGRALLADSEWPNKLRGGRAREINRCNLCQGCVDIMTTEFNGAGCSVNPRVGKELEFPLVKAASSKKVLVIGGGPGGLAAAVYACERGHQVTLVEKAGELGGAFRLASTLFIQNELFLDYLKNRVEDLPIRVILGRAADEETVREIDPDAIIVATGGRFSSPEIAGDDGRNVIKGAAVLDLVARARAGATADLGVGTSVVIIGANLIALELAELLARRGKRVHVVEPSRRMAMPAGKKRREVHCKELDRLGVPINTGLGVEGITAEGVLLSLPGGGERLLEAASVIVVGQPEADGQLHERLVALAKQVHVIGDASGFGLSKKAVSEAMQVAYGI